MSITETDVVARYYLYNGDLRDAYWWFLNGRIVQHDGKTPYQLFYGSDDGPRLVCQYVYLLTNNKIN